MIIPRDVLLEIAREFDIPEAAALVQRRTIHAGTAADHAVVDRVFDIARGSEGLALRSVARWRSYLTTMHFKFYDVWNHLRHARRDRVSPAFQTGSGGEVYVSTDPYAALPIAASLYHLDSWGIPGDAIECGCFKGVSAAMLSWACKFLGRKLWIADSFRGLPAVTSPGEAHYKTGDYGGSLDEVRRRIRTFGCEDVVGYIPGYFEESLPFVRERFALVWADVDLESSMDSVLAWLMPRLDPDGAFFSDEVPAASFRGSTIRADATSVPRAIREYFAAQGIPIPGRHLIHNVAAFARDPRGALFLTRDRVEALLLQVSAPRTRAKTA
ncbi:MAG: class I SAM-dependent methyltransferase [Acidobacteria bacterium]|nr:class I SAM-dependent methyltransferase [Acidobacteriota bacterium]